MTTIFIARCTDAAGEQVTPDGETFDTFESALESLLADTDESTWPTLDHATAREHARSDDGFTFDVQHVTGPSYRCAIVEASAHSDAHVRDDAEAEAFLLADGGTVPCSRYGRDSASCAPVAMLAARIMAGESGEPVTFRALDSDMGAVVNDSDGIADLLADYATDAELDAIGLDRADAYRLAGRVDAWEAEARQMGEDAARAAASWIVDGNTPIDSIRRTLALIDAGDDLGDYMPRRPNLSGEFADDPTPTSLARDVTGLNDAPAEIVDALADAFESGVDETFESACEDVLRAAAG